ncbi:hypothetical protein [Agrobacterium tumefaciens]|uniref:hypothetical protein n=1 Tax=Agrobacterium tumefaciens TaxID=358 RepID=UPI003BA34F08
MKPIEMDISKTVFLGDFSNFIFSIRFSFKSYGEAKAVSSQVKPVSIKAINVAYGHLPRVFVKVTSIMTNIPLVAGGQSIRCQNYFLNTTLGQVLERLSCGLIHKQLRVPRNLHPFLGTGAGRSVQENPEIIFHKEAAE